MQHAQMVKNEMRASEVCHSLKEVLRDREPQAQNGLAMEQRWAMMYKALQKASYKSARPNTHVISWSLMSTMLKIPRQTT